MTQTSEPIIDLNISHAMWGRILDNGDGITGDATGTAYALAAGSGDNVTVGAAGQSFRHNGFLHRITAAHTLTLNNTSATWTIGVVYDPARESNAEGPVYLNAAVSPFTPPAGSTYRELWRVSRSPSQTLAQSVAAATDLRFWAGEIVYAKTVAALPASPLGSLGVVEASGVIFRRRLSGGTVQWMSDDTIAVTGVTGKWGPYSAALAPEAHRDYTGTVHLDGTFKRTSVTPLTLALNQLETLGYTPPGYVPSKTHYLPCVTNLGMGELIVGTEVQFRAKGPVTFTAGSWVSICCSYRL